MTSPTSLRDSIQTLLDTHGFAVLATESAGQPHTSLIAITALDEGKRLIFATYRNTRKFSNLMQNQRVSVLIDGRAKEGLGGALPGFILSAVGHVQEINVATHPQSLDAHLQKHPDLATFTQVPDCVLLEVVVEAYQVVHGIDDVTWWRADELSNLPTPTEAPA
jgi:general stress protein 26